MYRGRSQQAIRKLHTGVRPGAVVRVDSSVARIRPPNHTRVTALDVIGAVRRSIRTAIRVNRVPLDRCAASGECCRSNDYSVSPYLEA